MQTNIKIASNYRENYKPLNAYMYRNYIVYFILTRVYSLLSIPFERLKVTHIDSMILTFLSMKVRLIRMVYSHTDILIDIY